LKKKGIVNPESGFTLIEVLVALTIFAIGLLAIAGMQVTAIQGNSKAHSVTTKTAIANGVLEQIMALSGDQDNDDIDVNNDGTNEFNNFLTTDIPEADPTPEIQGEPWPVDPEDLDGDGDMYTLNVDGAGICTVRVAVNADPNIDGTDYIGLTQITAQVISPDSNTPVTQTIMKRRY
jgi:type IV pilus assembly protein PilV